MRKKIVGISRLYHVFYMSRPSHQTATTTTTTTTTNCNNNNSILYYQCAASTARWSITDAAQEQNNKYNKIKIIKL
jgi:hypothetical protein